MADYMYTYSLLRLPYYLLPSTYALNTIPSIVPSIVPSIRYTHTRP